MGMEKRKEEVRKKEDGEFLTWFCCEYPEQYKNLRKEWSKLGKPIRR